VSKIKSEMFSWICRSNRSCQLPLRVVLGAPVANTAWGDLSPRAGTQSHACHLRGNLSSLSLLGPHVARNSGLGHCQIPVAMMVITTPPQPPVLITKLSCLYLTLKLFIQNCSPQEAPVPLDSLVFIRLLLCICVWKLSVS
jgi:hypothetical protein